MRRLQAWCFSQGLAVICANIFVYLIIVLLTRGFPDFLPFAVLTLTDIVGIGIFMFILNRIYRTLFPARTLLMIYEDYESNARLLARKMETRDDKYKIGEFIRGDEPMEVLQEKIRNSEGVVLCEVHSKRRNKIIKYCYGACIRVYVTPNISDIILRGSENLHFFDTPLLLGKKQRIIHRAEADQAMHGSCNIFIGDYTRVSVYAFHCYCHQTV